MEHLQATRRALLKSLSIAAAAGSVLRVIPLEAAEYAHHLIEDEKSTTAAYIPKFFDPHQYKTLQALCDTIIPADADSGGAIEAGAPEFIDLITSENAEYQKTLGDGSSGSTPPAPRVTASPGSTARRRSKRKSSTSSPGARTPTATKL